MGWAERHKTVVDQPLGKKVLGDRMGAWLCQVELAPGAGWIRVAVATR